MSNMLAMTPAQCRAARGLLFWSQKTLADHSSVNAFERNRALPRSKATRKNYVGPARIARWRKIFEDHGVEFIPGGVRFKQEEP